ncbi:MAG: ATP-dependent protease, partial [Candidatus Aminicenantes bacterium]|nr:ATP-dependent protease [Candidatus Aminicenantes bacterium]
MSEIRRFEEVPAEKLRPRCDPASIPYATSAECPSSEDIIGQDRAMRALQTGLDIKSVGYNIFITGMLGTGRTTSIKRLLERLEKSGRPPDDLLYVNNFRNPDEPTLLRLPTGQGRAFGTAMDHLVEKLKQSIPDLLKSPYYTEGRDAIVESQQRKQKDVLQAFEEVVAKEGFAVIQVQMGLFVKPDLFPVIEGQPLPFPKLEQLVREKKFPEEAVAALKAKYETLSGKLEDVFGRLRDIEEETRGLLKAWDDEALTPVVRSAVADIQAKFSDPAARAYLAEVEESL